MPSESHETILSEDRRQDATMRKIFDRVDLLYKHMWIITGILFLMVIIALGIGGYLIKKRSNDNAKRIKELESIVAQINNSRFENTFNVCIERERKDQGIKDFVLYFVARDENNRLFIKAQKTFPGQIKGSKARCETEALRKIKPPVKKIDPAKP